MKATDSGAVPANSSRIAKFRDRTCQRTRKTTEFGWFPNVQILLMIAAALHRYGPSWLESSQLEAVDSADSGYSIRLMMW